MKRSAVVLRARCPAMPDVDSSRIGLLGVSLGGNLASYLISRATLDALEKAVTSVKGSRC